MKSNTGKQSALVKLIQSLSQNEKRHFKLQASRNAKGGKGNYVLLFDLIDKHGNDSPKILAKHSSNATFIRQLPSLKHYLHNMLLRDLAAFHRNSSSSLQLRDLMNQAEVLIMKGFYEESQRILRKAKKLAKLHERHEFLISIAKWEELTVDTLLGEYESE
ncbi:MAG: hypothetical protein KDD54_11470, partial [Flavobacteriales bacterium]|nr:hypothetical protein [Flavobacteriales bacterium]